MSDLVIGILAPVQLAYATYGPLANATTAGQEAVADAVETAIGSLTDVASAADIPDEAPAGLVAGAYPPAIAAALAGLAATMTDGAAAQNVLPVMQRIQINLSATGEAVG